MLIFLREHELSKKITKPKQPRAQIQIAVPFWGTGGMKSLGLQKWKHVEVICNLESGGCNPYAIEELVKAGYSVRSYRRLHAKIYIFNEQVIIGSSNVSTNGLVEDPSETEGLVEANVLSDEKNLVGKARSLFRQLWNDKAAKVIELDSQFLKDAKEAWDRRPPGRTAVIAKTLLAACKEQPRLFNSVFLAIYTEDLGPKAKQKMKALHAASSAEPTLDVGDFQNAWGYQFPIEPGSWIIDFDCRKRGKIWGCAQVQNLVLNVPEEGDVVVAIKGNVRHAGSDREYKLSAKERALLEANSEALRELAGDRALVPLREALDHIGFDPQSP